MRNWDRGSSNATPYVLLFMLFYVGCCAIQCHCKRSKAWIEMLLLRSCIQLVFLNSKIHQMNDDGTDEIIRNDNKAFEDLVIDRGR